jgi:2-dehydro-3-deoxygluconokinase
MPGVVSFGETMIRLSTIRKERLEQSQYVEIRSAGAESNFCIGCRRMGVDATWVSKLTDNPLGRIIVNNLGRYGVGTSITWTNDYRVGTYYIEYGSFPRNTQIIYDRKDSAIRYIEPSEIDWNVLDGAGLVHLTGITVALGDRAKETLVEFIRNARKRNIKVSFDVNYRAKLWSTERARKEISEVLAEGVDYLFVGAGDAASVFGISGDNRKTAAWFKESFNPAVVVLTLGSEGAMAYDGRDYYFSPVQPSDTVDPIGSGDAFDAGFISSLLKGNDLQKSLGIGNAIASLKRTMTGDEPIVSYEEVLETSKRFSEGSLNHDKKGIAR